MHLVRHNRLAAPYHDYARLSVAEMDALAQGLVSPDIQQLPATLPFDMEALKAALFFVCSPSSRTQQTCEAVRARFGLTQPVRIDSDISEITFMPSLMKRETGDNVLETVRKNLYTGILSRAPGVEDVEILRARISRIDAAYRHENCVLFTHGFLIRLLKSRAKQGGSLDAGLRGIASVQPVEYLEWSTI